MLARLDSPWATCLFALAVSLLTWDYLLITPAVGLDAGWILGLNMAAQQGLDHGTQVVFTYGPLGFLEQPSLIDGTLATLGGIWVLGTRIALAATYLRAARRSFEWPLAALLALVGMALIPPSPGTVPLALVACWCLIALLDRESPRAVSLLAWGGGALAGVGVLIKLNTGLTMLAMVVVAVALIPEGRARSIVRLSVAFLATSAIGWFASGQGIGNIADYVHSAFEVISGYQRAMQVEAAPTGWDVWATAALAAAALVATVVTTSGLTAARRAGALAVVALLLFSLFKYAYVRHDAPHVVAFFGTLPAIWLALRWRGGQRAVACAALAATAAISFPTGDQALDRAFAPGTAFDQLGALLIPSLRADDRDSARAQMVATYGADPRIIERVDDQPADVRPWDIGLAWAYGLDWDPLPVLQDYVAYTPDLDRLNAEAAESADGPRFIIRHLVYNGGSQVGVDGRLTSFDTPLETRALACDYEPVITTDTMQLLERGSDRCGPERPLRTVTAAYGEPVPVPRAGRDDAVFARVIGAGGHGVERLRTLAYREAVRTVTLDGTTRTRVVPATAADGLLLHLPADAEFPPPFSLAADAKTIAIDSEGGFATSDRELTIEFFAQKVRPYERPGG